MRTLAQEPKGSQPTGPSRAAETSRTGFGRVTDGSPILHMQRAAGNRAVQHLVGIDAARTPGGIRAADALLPGGSTGAPLQKAIRTRLERWAATPLADVRVHTDSAASRAARELGARAFTAGRSIYFREGAYAPGSEGGGRLLAHEIAHVLQSRVGAAPARSTSVGVGRRTWKIGGARDPAEREARAAATAFSLGRRPKITRGRDGPGVVRRDPEGDAAPAPTLTNARFTSDRVLRRILSGRIPVLSSAHDGRRGAVSKVQQALVALGFELPMHQVDGSYGTETEEALRQFRARYGPSPGSQLDGATLAVLDRVAPPPGESHEHTVDYDRLLADRRLDVTVAIGATDHTVLSDPTPGTLTRTSRPVEELRAERFRAWMTSHGFGLELLGWSANEYWKATRTITWTGADGTEHSREVDIWINLVVPAPGAAAEYGAGLSSDEITIYSGHARYGSGPDFDAKASPVENFRIGIDRALRDAGRRTAAQVARSEGVALDAEHDLRDMVSSGNFDPARYRVLFFNACTSLAYLDEVRDQIGGPENVDVVGTRRVIWGTSVESRIALAEVQRFLEGILAAESIESMVRGLTEVQRRAHPNTPIPRGTYSSSGAGDNPRAP